VSSISAVPASAGIPVTHRGVSSQVTIASGHDPATLDLRRARAGAGDARLLHGLRRAGRDRRRPDRPRPRSRDLPRRWSRAARRTTSGR
jgi:siroheme synthase